MKIRYKSNKLENECTIYSTTIKAYGEVMAVKIHQRIGEILAVDSIETLVRCKIGRCHPLSGDRNGEYAMDLIHPHRLVFKQVRDEVGVAFIISIENYH